MFRTKQAVDRHVRELFRKVIDENERTLRCYNIAKLYYQVEDYESARRYVSCYLEVKGDQSGPHKLLGKIYESLGQKESALAQYKQSLEIEPRQDDLVLKVCELLADMEIGHDANSVKYWVDRADERFPHHPIVFQLKEKILTVDRPNDASEDLEALIAAELSARPSDVQLRVKLLKYYIDKNRLEDAYKHAVEVESTHAHRDSVVWYEALCDLLTKFKDGRLKWTFWILYVSSLERYAALSLKEQGHVMKKTIPEAAQAVFNFDQALTEAKIQNFSNNPTFAEQMFNHMWGQLHYHLACLLLRKTKREQGSWSDAGRLCAPLLLTAMHISPIDHSGIWAVGLKEKTKKQLKVWEREGSYRCSQAGHVLENYSRDDVKRMMEKIDKFCTGSWRERIYQRIFVSKAHIATSYFANHTALNPPLRLCSGTEMKIYDEASEEAWPASLHHHVWLGIVNNRSSINRNNIYAENGPWPNQYCHVFPVLQLSVFNLSQAAPDSLGQLDIDAFLNAAVLCASVVVEEQQRSGFLNPDRLPTLPADITNTLCTCTQEKWWSSAYKIYRKHVEISGDLGEIRQELQRGLEVVRCIGNHGLHPAILVHLARIFHHRAKLLKEKDKNHSDLPFIEARCELYWSAVVPLLERLLNNQTIRTTSTKMFDYQGKEMNNVELTNALEEGRLFLAQKYVREKQHEQAIEALQALKCPEASFLQGEIYKSLADELMSTLPKESLTSAMRSQHVVMLSKARGCYYLTLDRLRSPGMNPKHPLNSELGSRIADIENDLKRIDPDVWRGDFNRHECDMSEEESCSSARSGEQPVIQNSFIGGLDSTIHMTGTPQKSSAHRTPKQASTPCRAQHQDILELTRKSAQQEARPSPERLDAQIRQLIHSKDNMIQTIVEQNKILLETNKSLVESSREMREKIDELQKQFENFCRESEKNVLAMKNQRSQNNVRTSVSQNNHEEDIYVFGDDDYGDYSYSQNQQTVANNQQQQQQQQQQQIQQHFFNQRNPYAPLVYPQNPVQGYYQSTIPGFNDPHGQQIPSIYGAPRIFPIPAYYPRPGIDQNLAALQKMPENMIFSSRINQIPEIPQQIPPAPPVVIPQQPQQAQILTSQLSMQLQNNDKNDTKELKNDKKDRSGPINVVITTSDTLPTTAPSVQPQLSVTIPPQYRAITVTNAIPAAHSYQISMPSHAMIPTTVNLPPLSTTITNTISATVAEQERKSKLTGPILSTSCNSNDSTEIEHDPLPDFVPVIPLPDEIKVTTGEENEEELFCARAKLYRWSEHEWKERGIGCVKLLKNTEGRVRLVMRREQVLKICANHMISPDMELTKMMDNEKAWIWVANDFADEEVRLEKLCIRFKHIEEAQNFKEFFDKAKNLMKSLKIMKNDSIIVDNVEKKIETKIGGFSFNSEPILRKNDIEKIEQKSPFASFTFTKNSADTNFSFDSSLTKIDDSSKNSLRRPHAPSPASIAKTDNFDKTKIFDDNESTIYEKRTNLVRRNPETGQWKNRGFGNVNIIVDLKNGKLRFYVKRDDNGKIFANFEITTDTKFAVLKNTDNVVTWSCQDSKVKSDNSGCLFENSEETKEFCDFFTLLKSKMKDNRLGLNYIVKDGKNVRFVGNEEKSLAMFKPPKDSWECDSCYTRNDSKVKKCVACDNERDKKNTENTENSNLWNRFKPQPDSWECRSCYIRNVSENSHCVACDSPKDPNVPEKQGPIGFNADNFGKSSDFHFGMPKNDDNSIADIFKPKPGSWECQDCLLRNEETADRCVACEKSKDFGVKSKIGNFDTKNTAGFTFGLPIMTSKDSGFTFKLSSQDEKNDDKTIFGTKIQNTGSNFVFGVSQDTATIFNDSTGFTFGSPGKSFDFQFNTKSPIKSPADRNSKGETSEDEVAESDDIYFAPVVPLPDKIDVKTGEEEEEIVYAHRAKLFRYDPADKEWKERGLGDIKILKNPLTKKLRMLMRRDQTLKLCLNHAINRDLELKSKDDKTWLWNAADYSEGDIEYLQLACRFKTPEIAKEFKRIFDESVDKGFDENSAKTIADNEQIQDVQVVYELKVTDEEKNAALKLQLPDNFYAYRRKKDCPGCIGCREPEIDIFTDKSDEKSAEKSKIVSPIVAKIAPPKFTGIGNFSKNNEIGTGLFGKEEKKSVNQQFGEEKQVFGFTFEPSSSASDKTIFSAPTIGKSPPILTSNLTICSPIGTVNNEKIPNNDEKKTQEQNIPKVTSIFGGSNFTGSIFSGTSNTGISIFGGYSAPKITNESSGNEENNVTGNNLFSGKSATHTFGNSAIGGNIFGSGTDTKLTFGSLATTSDKEISTKDTRENEKPETISFLPVDSSATFSALAAQSTAEPSFKTDPNFSFAGAGATVFGGKASILAGTETSTNDQPEVKKIGDEKEPEDDADDENNESQEHDPQFEPIVPLPDTIEVRTGEEDEIKIFSHRAKLYRFEKNTKEWKERGVGEMKILHHSEHGTYRFLLRREQVHKLVCNQLLTLSIDLRPLCSSDRAWMWAGYNHAEPPYGFEDLAVKFKNPEIAIQFKEAVDKVKLDLQERQAIGQGRVTESESTDCYGEEQEDDVDEDDEDDEDEEHEEPSMIFHSPTELLTLQDNNWLSLGTGTLKILYDADIYGAKIIVEADNTGEILSNTIITIETMIEINENYCTWTAFDEVLNPPIKRSLRAIFTDVEIAQAMYMNFQDGQEYAKHADISESSYFFVGTE